MRLQGVFLLFGGATLCFGCAGKPIPAERFVTTTFRVINSTGEALVFQESGPGIVNDPDISNLPVASGDSTTVDS